VCVVSVDVSSLWQWSRLVATYWSLPASVQRPQLHTARERSRRPVTDVTSSQWQQQQQQQQCRCQCRCRWLPCRQTVLRSVAAQSKVRSATCGRRRQGHYLFYFVSIDERPAMRSQPILASRSEMVSIYKCPPIISGPFPKYGAQKYIKFWPLFRDFRTRHRISPERNVASTNKNASVNIQCLPLKLTYFSWPLTQKRLRSVCLLWPPFGGHYAATIIIATCLVIIVIINIIITKMYLIEWRCRKNTAESLLDLRSTGRGFKSYSGQKLRNNLEQVIHTYVPLSPSDIT